MIWILIVCSSFSFASFWEDERAWFPSFVRDPLPKKYDKVPFTCCHQKGEGGWGAAAVMHSSIQRVGRQRCVDQKSVSMFRFLKFPALFSLWALRRELSQFHRPWMPKVYLSWQGDISRLRDSKLQHQIPKIKVVWCEKCWKRQLSHPLVIFFLPVFWCFRDYMENRIYDEQLMGTEQNEYLLIVPDKLYLKTFAVNKSSRQWNSWRLHFNVGLTGGAVRAAGTLFASADCPFTADVELFTLPGGALTLFDDGLLFDCDCASVDVTVVLETCREPDDLRPLDEPIDGRNVSVSLLTSASFHCIPELGEFWLPRDDVRGGCGPVGGLPLFRGLPGGKVSEIDIKLAIGLNDVVIDESPRDTAGSAIVAG